MRYHNKKTGALIESSGALSGGDWQLEAAEEDVIEPDGMTVDAADNKTSPEEKPASKNKSGAKK